MTEIPKRQGIGTDVSPVRSGVSQQQLLRSTFGIRQRFRNSWTLDCLTRTRYQAGVIGVKYSFTFSTDMAVSNFLLGVVVELLLPTVRAVPE